MPLYEYQCSSCHQVVEIIQKFSDPPLDKCASCGGLMSRLLSKTSFHLKGSGWYATDYKKGTSPKPSTLNPPAEAKSAEAPTATPATSTTDSKKEKP